MITSLSLETLIRSKKVKKERFVITNFILKNISKIIKKFEDFNYEVCVRKTSKHIPTDSYFCLATQLLKFMIIFNIQSGPVRM